MDWLSWALPHEGSALLAGDVLDPSVPTCGLETSVAEAARRTRESGEGFCVAVTDPDVVMGMVVGGALEDPEERLVEEAMAFGVSTVRASEDVAALVERMRRADVEMILVTSPDARLLGLLRREEAEAALRRGHG